MTARFLRAALLCAGFALPALADDAPFLGTDPASVPAKGEIDVQQWLSWGYGGTGQSYNGIQSLTEVDYALTDRIQLALTVSYDWTRSRPPGGPAETSSLMGLQGELIYVVAPIDTSPVGIALALDPAYAPNARAFALRLLLTKYFARFENVLNINFENAWDKDEFGHWQESGAIGFNYGIAHALDKHWTLAIEFGNQLSFSQLVTSGSFRDSANTMYLGPTIEYDCDMAVFTFGVQTQLPLAVGSNTLNGYTVDAERWRAGFRVARAI